MEYENRKEEGIFEKNQESHQERREESEEGRTQSKPSLTRPSTDDSREEPVGSAMINHEELEDDDSEDDNDETDETEEDLDVDDLVETNDITLQALIDLLLKKGLITGEELEQAIDDVDEDDDDEDEDLEEGGEEGEKSPVVKTGTEAADDGAVPNIGIR